MRVYISGPMRGLPDLNFPAFNAAAEGLRAAGHRVYNPADTGERPNWTLRDYAFIDLAWICNHAEAIALLPGWRDSKGATAEYHTAVWLGLTIIELE